MRKNLLSALAATLLVGATQAQEVACKINNYSIHTGFKNSGFPVHGLEVGYIQHLGKLFDLYVPVRVGPRGDVKRTVNTEVTKTLMMGAFAADVAIQAKYDNGHNFVIPFISTGVGVEQYDGGLELGSPVGGGLNFRVKPKVLVSLTTNYRFCLNPTAPVGFCHSLGVIVNLRNKEANEKPFISKKPVNSIHSDEDYAKQEAEAQAKKAEEARVKAANEALLEQQANAAATAKAQKEAQAKADAESALKAAKEAQAKQEAELAAKAEEVRLAKMQATVPVEVSTEVQKVLNYALKGVQFETGSAQLIQSSYPILDELAATMAQNPNLRISIEGHTDRTGNESINMKLSEARAKACMTYLISKGVSSERLKESGLGSTRPLSDNNTDEGRSMNRRVEFVPF
jgi:outer membrane protein OmpA-like peptidoglycan-associated protein